MSSCQAPAQVTVSAPSRLHFGLLAFGREEGRQYGGVGVAINAPRWQLEFAPSASLHVEATAEAEAAECERVRQFARRWSRFTGCPVACAIRLVRTVEAHVGLGSGTQLALSVATGLSRLHGLTLQPPALAASVGRGSRSSVGTYAFLRGGLIIDAGKHAHQSLGPLAARIVLPDHWSFLLLRIPGAPGCSGAAETRAFAELPPVPIEVSRQLSRELHGHLLPAASAGDFAAFSQSLFRYGTLAGSCFAALQGGPFGGPQAERMIIQLQDWGITGLGQSSWGPTLFALLASQAEAEQTAARLRGLPQAAACQLQVVSVDNHGARIR